MVDLYQEHILDAVENPEQSGKIDDADVTLETTNASCGDQVTIYLTLNGPVTDPTTTIEDIKWQGDGCVISQSATELLSRKIAQEKLTIQAVRNLDITHLLELLGLETISPGRVRCLLLALQVLKDELGKE